MAAPHYQPSPRVDSHIVPIGGRVVMWGGWTRDFCELKPQDVQVEVFEPSIEKWDRQSSSGEAPPHTYQGAYAAIGKTMYVSCGSDGKEWNNNLYGLDSDTYQWRGVQATNPDDGPMPKYGCAMIAIDNNKLALIGGYGTPQHQIQRLGVSFDPNPGHADGRGWTNEFHLFLTKESMWSVPEMTGDRPPPCSAFTFTAVDDNRAVFFAGRQRCGRVNDAYILNHRIMHWTKLKNKGGPWPKKRSLHAACCIDYGGENPLLLVSGGIDEDYNTLKDLWLLHVNASAWKEIELPQAADLQPRCRHSLTAISLAPGLTEVTMFAGCPQEDVARTMEQIPKVADTEILRLESVEGPFPSEWVITGVTKADQLGQPQSLREKLLKLREHGAFTWAQRGRETRASSEQPLSTEEDQVHLTQSEARRELAESEVTELRSQIVHAEEQMKEAERRITEVEQSAEARVGEAERGRREAESGRLAAERGRQEAERRVHEVESGRLEEEERRREAERQREGAEREREAAERGRRTAEERVATLDDGDMRRREEEELSWVVRREEIQLSAEELGRGGWAVVKVAKFRGLRVAAKCLHQQIISDYSRHIFTREMNLAARIRHPNLLLFIGATIHGDLIILTELMSTSLREFLEQRPLTPPQCSSIALDVAAALNYLHLMRPNPIIHRDISSANVLLEPVPNNRWRAKISDYGSANFLRQLRTENPGAALYAAPEASTPNQQSTKMDIYSFGILLVELFTARFPDVDDRERLIQSITDNRLVRLIRQCIAKERNSRPTAPDIITQLSTL